MSSYVSICFGPSRDWKSRLRRNWSRRVTDGSTSSLPGESASNMACGGRTNASNRASLTSCAARVMNVLSAPLIYSLIIPIALLDFWITVYQRVCFPICRISRVSPAGCIVIATTSGLFERHRKSQLCLLRLRQWRVRLCAGNRPAD